MAQNNLKIGTFALVALMAGVFATHAAEPAKPSTVQAPRSTLAIPPDEASQREMRQAALKVQQRLRAEQRARSEAQRADTKNERCIGGQRMRRVANGWVDAGAC